MIFGGEFNYNNIISSENNIDFERYCKNEGLDSLQLKREIYILNIKHRRNKLKAIVKLVKSVLIYKK